MKEFLLFTTLLELFGEGGGDGSGSTATTSGDSNTNPVAPEQGQSRKGEYRNVYYGKLPEEMNQGDANLDSAKAQPQQEVDLEKEFDELVRTKYKDVYSNKTQKMINARFKETKQLEQQLKDQNIVLDTIYDKYGITDRDIKKLGKAIDDDYNMWADAADREGLTVDTYKEMVKIKRQNEQLQQQQQAQIRAQQDAERIQQWRMEEAELKKTFPDFNIETEYSNPAFAKLLNAGVPVEHAFKVVHMDDIVSNAMKTSANLTEKRVADSVRAKGNRPSENGTSTQASFVHKSDVASLTKGDRAEAVKRAERGEIIRF